MDEERGDEPDRSAADEYPKSPGASKMEALRRIERSLEHQTEQVSDREEDADARKGEPENEGSGEDPTGGTGGDSGE